MTRIVLISASPTRWDDESRLGGTHSLPLTEAGAIALHQLVETIQTPLSAVYTFKKNEGCEQAARFVSRKFGLRIRDAAELEPMSLGLWQGLTRDELRFRYPKVFPLWEENALAVNPPEGEEFAAAVDRLSKGVEKILKKSRGQTVALVVRPMSLRIIAGLLKAESVEYIARHLHERAPMETIERVDE
jgi:broad specificity phosphatase PhoE